jgi:dihydrodipicolinate synthase/N-acetylneuraminate lyase
MQLDPQPASLTLSACVVPVAGTTGEGYCLTVAERKTLLEAWIAKAQRDITVIAHIGCEALADVVDLAKHARIAGAAAISVMPSVFFKPASIEILIKVGEIRAGFPPKTWR